jgi:hypothetical protein
LSYAAATEKHAQPTPVKTSCVAARKAHGILCTLAATFAAFAAFAAFAVVVAAFAVEELMDLADSVLAYHFLEYFPHVVDCSLFLIR